MKIVIAGGGRVGSALATRLVADRHAVTVIERERALCDWLFEEVGVVAVCGDATDPRALEEAGVGSADIATAVLARDADNLAFAGLARAMSNARVMVRMLDARYRPAYRMAGVREVVAEAEVVVSKMATAIDFPQVAGSLPLAAGSALLFELPISARALVAGRTVAEVRADARFPRDCLFIGFVDAAGEIVLPSGATALRPGDTAILVAKRQQVGEAIRFLAEEPDTGAQLGALLPALRRIDFLSGLAEPDLETLARAVRKVRYARGEGIFRKGDPGEYFFLVLEGSVALTTDDGRTLEDVGPGGFFGEIALLTGEPRSTNATAGSDVELGAISKDEFRTVSMRTPSVALEMSRVLGQRLATMARAARPEKKGLFRK